MTQGNKTRYNKHPHFYLGIYRNNKSCKQQGYQFLCVMCELLSSVQIQGCLNHCPLGQNEDTIGVEFFTLYILSKVSKNPLRLIYQIDIQTCNVDLNLFKSNPRPA